MQDQTAWIINVHGTGAAAKEDIGNNWWQSGSDFSSALGAHLPAHIQFLPAEKTFHWSGDNSERARERAARDLLSFMKGLDKPFHIIAHSHGGSVAWRALQMSLFETIGDAPASASRKGLTLLQSWTTIGTPFLNIQPEPIVVNQFTLIYRLAALLAFLLFVAATGYLGYALLGLIPALSWSVNPGWVIEALVALPLSLLGMLVGLKNTAGFFEALTLEISKPLHVWAARVYGSRWLPLWSEDDEAILAIEAARVVKGEFAPRIDDIDPVFGTDVLLRFFRWPTEKLWNKFYNRRLAPRGDKAFISILRKIASGNDLPGTFIGQVSPGPAPSLQDPPPLDATLQKELVDHANEGLRASVPEIRPVLARLATSNIVLADLKKLGLISGEEMVHTSYYRNPSVIALIGTYVNDIAADRASQSANLWLLKMAQWKQASLQALQANNHDPGSWTMFRWMANVLADGKMIQGFYNAMPIPGLLWLARIALRIADSMQQKKFAALEKEAES